MFKKPYKKIFIFILFLSIILIGNVVLAEGETDRMLKARILEVVEQRENELPDGVVVEQQNLRLIGLEGEIKDKEFVFNGIGDYDVLKKRLYNEGDTVLTAVSYDNEGNVYYYVTDYVRTNNLII